MRLRMPIKDRSSRPPVAPAVPTLLELLRKEELSAAGFQVAEAIKTIDPVAAESAGVK